MYQPVKVPKVVCYAGSRTILGRATFQLELEEGAATYDFSGWQDWKAHWRYRDVSQNYINLDVDVDTINGTITVSASGEATRDMRRNGVWDVQSVRDGEERTWLRGETKWESDVTRD